MAILRYSRQDTPMRREPVRVATNNDTKIPGHNLQPDQMAQLNLQLALEPTQELHVGFLSGLGVSVRAMNVLVQMQLKSAAQFVALDEQTLLRRRNCGKKTAAEIMDVVTRYKPASESISTEMLSMAPAQENAPIAYLRLSVRAAHGLESLKISTAGQLAKVSDRELLSVQNFGKSSLREVRLKLAAFRSRGFVVWPADEQATGELSSQITRAARKLQRLRNASAMHYDDPRFGHLIREMDLKVTNLHEAADMLVARKADPVNPRLLIRLLGEIHRTVRRAASMSLEAELFSMTDGLGNERDRRIIMSYLGWDGKPPRTLEVVGQEHKMTRERVRQICGRVNTQRSSKTFLPVLDRVLKICAAATLAPVEEIENRLLQRRLTEGKFQIESVCSAANVFGREIRFAVEKLHGHQYIVMSAGADLLNQIDHVARVAVSQWGATTVDDVAAAINADPVIARKVLIALPGFRWLDELSGWFWIENLPRNALLTQIRKILVGAPIIDVGELRTGTGRHHRRKGFAPPRRVLLELCSQLPWCRVSDQRISAVQTLNPNEILNDSERILLQVLKEHGPVMPRPRFEELCLNAGMNQHSFWIYLSYCPIISRYAPGVFGLRGAEVTAGLVESLIPRRTPKTKLIIDYGWTKDRNLQVVYRVSSSMLSNGIVSIPSALKDFLHGSFALITGDDSRVGKLTINNGSAWGLGPFFSRRGGDPGDYLLINYDLAKREAKIQMGDAEIIDSMELPERVARGPDGNAMLTQAQVDSWNTRYSQLVELKNRSDHFRVCWSTQVHLGRWMTFQRHLRRLGKLDPARVRRLDEIGFPWNLSRRPHQVGSAHGRSWEERFQQMVEFKNSHGHCRVHHIAEKVLWGWAVRQRRAKRAGKLDADCIHHLERIGFQWGIGRGSSAQGTTASPSWESRFQELLEFKNQHGHCNVPRAANQALGLWVSNQRHTKKVNKLSEDRARKLEEIGFQWETSREPRRRLTGSN